MIEPVDIAIARAHWGYEKTAIAIATMWRRDPFASSSDVISIGTSSLIRRLDDSGAAKASHEGWGPKGERPPIQVASDY
jgi:hypothetical protein